MSAGVNPVSAKNPYAPPRARVRDVAAPKAQLVLAEPTARLGAAIVDSLIFSAMVYIPLIIGMVIAGVAGGNGDNAGALTLIGFGLGLVGFIVWTYLTLKQMGA